MQPTTLLLAFIATAVAIPAGPGPFCNGVGYNPASYQCYGNQICPIANGDVQRPCGKACYSQYNYTCTANQTLVPLPHVVGPFLLQVLSSNSSLNGQYVQACTRRFWVGEGPCTFCPQNVSTANLCPQGDQTQFIGGGALNVEVPGGQNYYLDPDGALSFSSAHSGNIPHDAILNATAYQGGMFIYNEVKYPPSTWVACPKINGTTPNGGRTGAPGIWQIFGKLRGVNFREQQGCQGVTLIARAGEKEYVGAWEYV